MAGGDTGGAKGIFKFLLVGFIVGAILAYTVEYSGFGSKNSIGFIILILLMWVASAGGIAAAHLDNWMAAIGFVVVYTTLFLVFRHYVGGGAIYFASYGFIWGSLAACCGAMFAITCFGGGGGGK